MSHCESFEEPVFLILVFGFWVHMFLGSLACVCFSFAVAGPPFPARGFRVAARTLVNRRVMFSLNLEFLRHAGLKIFHVSFHTHE